MELTTERLTLREICLADAEKIHELHSLPETDRFNTLGIPASIKITEQLVADWLADKQAGKKYVFCIENTEKEFIGLIGINMGKPAYKSAGTWYKISPRHWNQGYATEALDKVLHFCFTGLALHRVEAGCAVENTASKRVLEKAGMMLEGRCREILPIRGQWVDNFEFAILETDFAGSIITKPGI